MRTRLLVPLALAASLVSLVSLMTTPAAAELDGFFRGGLGVGNLRTRSSVAASPPSITEAMSRTTFTGELSAGATIDRSWVVAATLLEHIVTLDRNYATTSPFGGETALTLTLLGITVEHHPKPRGGLFYGGTVGVCEHALRTVDRPVGFGIAAYGGWDFAVSARSSFGVGVRLLYARMSVEVPRSGVSQAFAPSISLHYVFR